MSSPNIQNRPTHRYLTDLMRSLVRDDIDSACAIFGSKAFDFEKACELLKKNGLSGYFYTLVRNTELADLVPGPILDQLAADYHAQKKRILNNVALLGEIQGALSDASIPYLSLKGLYLGQRFFGDASRRFMWDLDILVHPEDFKPAIAAMATIHLHPSSPSRFDPTNPFWGIHAMQVRGDAGYLDIHHAIRSLPKINFDHATFWRDAVEFQLGDSRFPTLCDADTLLVSTIGLGADIQNSHHNLRKIWDVYMMLRELDATTDWQFLFAEYEKQGCLKLVLNVFSFCLLLLNAGQDCPRLERAMSSSNPDLMCISSEKQTDQIFARNRQSISNRLLFSHLLPVSPIHYWLDWMVTLPIRVWNHRKG